MEEGLARQTVYDTQGHIALGKPHAFRTHAPGQAG